MLRLPAAVIIGVVGTGVVLLRRSSRVVIADNGAVEPRREAALEGGRVEGGGGSAGRAGPFRVRDRRRERVDGVVCLKTAVGDLSDVVGEIGMGGERPGAARGTVVVLVLREVLIDGG